MKLPFSGRHYYLKFGLERDPFPQKSTEQKVFLTHEMIHCLDQIKESVDNSKQLVLVTSPPGAGKSVLSRYLGFIRSSSWFVGHVQGHRELDKETLAYEIIRQHFPERRFAQSRAMYLLKEFLQLFARNGRTPVIIIDDTHLLSLETLKFILEMAGYRQQEAQYQFVLFGDMGMEERLKTLNVQNFVPGRYHHFRIPPLSLQQTRKYLEYRLSLCGECREDPFNDECVQEIYIESAGLPGDMHALAKRIMQDHQVEGSARQLLLQATVTASVCLLVFTGVYSAMNEDYIEKSGQAAKSGDTRVEVIPLSLPGTGTLIKPAAYSRSIVANQENSDPVIEKRRSDSFIARLFRKEVKEKYSSGRSQAKQKRTGRHQAEMVASLDSQLSLRLSDIIEK